MIRSKLLGVNVDHVATLRQARGTPYPDPIEAAIVAEDHGADYITIHLREDRRHIQDRDVPAMIKAVKTYVNLESAITPEMVAITQQYRPQDCCFVPERREELTTEGGLDVRGQIALVKSACEKVKSVDVRASLFIDPDINQIDAVLDTAAPVIELHTGAYAEAFDTAQAEQELTRIRKAADYAHARGLIVNAGHGLTVRNIGPVIQDSPIAELNIGHAIIARAVFVGLGEAVAEMKRAMQYANADY